jgi:hypothetical protein
MIPNERTQEEHDGWTEYLVHHVLFGPVLIWDHPEFLAMREGFDFVLGRTPSGPRLIRVCFCSHSLLVLIFVAIVRLFGRHTLHPIASTLWQVCITDESRMLINCGSTSTSTSPILLQMELPGTSFNFSCALCAVICMGLDTPPIHLRWDVG